MQVKNIQHVSFTIAGGAASGTASLTGFTTLGQMVVVGTWTLPALANITEAKAYVDLDVTSTGLLTASRVDATAGEVIEVEAFVVEYGADTNVYKGAFTSTGAGISGYQTDTFNINGGSPMALGDLTKAFGWVYYNNDDTTSANDWRPSESLGSWLADTSQMSVRRASKFGDISGHFYVVESSTIDVQHGTATDAGTAVSVEAALTSLGADLTHSFIVASYIDDQHTWHSDSNWTADIYDNASVHTARMRRKDADTGEWTFYYQVVTDPDIFVQRGAFTYTTVSAFSNLGTPVDLDAAVVISGGLIGHSTRNGDQFTAGHADEFTHRMWLSDTNTLEVRATTAGANRLATWEVVQFDKETGGPAPRRVMVR